MNPLLAACGLLCVAALSATLREVARDGYRQRGTEPTFGMREPALTERAGA